MDKNIAVAAAIGVYTEEGVEKYCIHSIKKQEACLGCLRFKCHIWVDNVFVSNLNKKLSGRYFERNKISKASANDSLGVISRI